MTILSIPLRFSVAMASAWRTLSVFPPQQLLLLLLLLFICSSNTVVVSAQRHWNENDGHQHQSGGILLSEQPITTLSNGKHMPLVGLGVGNLQHNLIESQIREGMRHNVRLIDTAHASNNEQVIARGIEQGVAAVRRDRQDSFSSDSREQVHVITKVWYTHLGYARTVLSVRDSLEALRVDAADVRVHVLIHWPYCRDDISWMDCEGEEARLPREVQEAGPAPHLYKDNAWKESWRALEDIFTGDVELNSGYSSFPKVESIGVSNFEADELHELLHVARVAPSILQANLWTILFDPVLVNLCHAHHIHLQAFNLMNGVFGRARERTPRALDSLWMISRSLKASDGHEVSAPELVIKWLVQNDVSVIPRTSSERRLIENSPRLIYTIPELEERNQEQVKHTMALMMQGEDLEPPKAVFVNQHTDSNRHIHLFWANTESGEEHLVKEGLSPGDEFRTNTFPGHKFIAYDGHDPQNRQEFIVQAQYGEQERFHVEL